MDRIIGSPKQVGGFIKDIRKTWRGTAARI